ncbi:transcriptional activator FtrA [Aquisphaera giovannonii]|uniref:Transcriptional activator FtrA n=1 Tax=Aquisphaera giovannonii TaxID=406548 RepID=A0A5B9VUU8_9BACT|nr:helix-turn-helix domain-containing protein [Aquisphaera giovannonii]QEH32052.1 transcriptional activator FtrA [Aquisphaera giovannonii]
MGDDGSSGRHGGTSGTPAGGATGGGGRFRRDPHPSLRPFVVEYWGLARDLAAMGGFTITPDRFGELICCADALYAVGRDGRERLPDCFLVGLLEGPLRIEADGVVRCMAARLQPWTVGRLLARGPGPTPGGWMAAGALLGPRLARVVELVRGRDWEALFGIYDRILMEEIGRRDLGGAAIEVVGPFLGEGPCPTAAVADGRDTSRRQVERRVRALTGTSPKRLAGLARFQRARDAIWADPAIGLAGLAISAGYSDQAHMTREFRRYAGQTPARFAREMLARKLQLAALDVAFVQDPPSADA